MMPREQIGARFLAESEIWRASEAEPTDYVGAPLVEFAVRHMKDGQLAKFVGWRAGLPKMIEKDRSATVG